MIFITGATGSIGNELCQLLAKDNIPAKAMCRKQEQLNQFIELGLEAVLADFDHPESIKQALHGCRKLFLLTPPTPAHTQLECSVIDMAMEAGVTHIVKLSTSDTNLSAKLSYAKSHAEVDHYLKSKPVNWTILRPTGFMQNFIESGNPIAKGMLPHMLGEGQLSYIDLRDIARVAKQVLITDGHNEAIYYLTGPDSLTMKQVAEQLTIALEHPVKDVNLSEADMRKTLAFAKLSAWHIDSLIDQFNTVAGGYEIDTTCEVKRLTGQSPRTILQFAKDYKEQFIAHA